MADYNVTRRVHYIKTRQKKMQQDQKEKSKPKQAEKQQCEGCEQHPVKFVLEMDEHTICCNVCGSITWEFTQPSQYCTTECMSSFLKDYDFSFASDFKSCTVTSAECDCGSNKFFDVYEVRVTLRPVTN